MEAKLVLDEAQATANIGYWQYEVASNTLQWSEHIFTIFDTTRAEFNETYEAFLSFVHPEDKAEVIEAYRLHIQQQLPYKIEHRIITNSGKIKYVEEHCTTIFNQKGEAVKSTGIVLDITDRKLKEQALEASESSFAYLFNNMAQGVVYQNAEGFITLANPAAQQLLGLSLDQLQGKTSVDPDWYAIKADGSPFPGQEHPAMVALQTGKPVLGVEMGVHHPGKDKYVWILVSAHPEFKPGQSAPFRVFATFNDITSLKETEISLNKRNQQMVQAGQLTLTGTWEYELISGNINWNDTTRHIYEVPQNHNPSLEEVISYFLPSGTGVTISELINKAIEEGIEYDAEFPIITAKRNQKWVRVMGIPEIINGECQHVYGVVQDISPIKTNELNLKKNTELLEQTAKLANIGAFDLDLASKNLAWSKTLYQIHELEPHAKLTLEKAYEFFDGDYLTLIKKAAHDAIHHKKPYDLELQFTTAKGSVRWGRAIGHPLIQEDSVVRLIGSFQDITDTKMQIQQLQETTMRLKSLVNSQTHFLIRTNLNGHYTFWNQKYEDEFDYLIFNENKEVNTVVSTVAQHHHQAMRDALFRCIQYPGETIQVELDKPLPNKTGFRTTLWEFVCLTDADGAPTEIQCMGIDISERKQGLVKLKESENKYRRLIENAPDIIFKYDIAPEARLSFISSSAEAITGYSELDFYQNPDLMMQFLTPLAWDHIKTTVLESGVRGIECEAIKRNGEKLWLEIRMSPVVDDDQNLMAIEGIARDITELRIAIAERNKELKLQELLMNISANFVNIPEDKFDETINQAMQELGCFVNADRFYIFEYDHQNLTASNTHEWCNLDIEPQISILQNYPMKEMEAFLAQHLRGEKVVISDVSQLPPHEMLRQTLEFQEIKSAMMVPLMYEDECCGFIGLDFVKQVHLFTNSEERLLQVFSNLLVNAKQSRQNKQKLRESQARIKSILESSTESIWSVNHRYQVVYANQVMLKDFETVFQMPLQVNDVILDYLPLHLRQKWKAFYDQALSGKSHEFREVIEVNGDERFHVQVSMYPIEVNGQVVSVSVFSKNITDEINAQLALEESEERFRRLFEKNASVMYLFDAETGQFLDVNPAGLEYYGYTRKEFLELNVQDINLLGEATLAQFYKVKEFGKFQFEFKHRLANGQIRNVEVFSSLIESNKKARIHSIVIDTTEKNKYLETILKQNMAFKEIARVQSHELRAPLTRAMGLMKILEIEDYSGLTKEELVNALTQSLDELDLIIQNIVNKAYKTRQNE